MNYRDKLLDPKWKRKRKKILKRDGYKCTACGSTKNLNVHHTFYYSDWPNPWEYPDSSLLTACKDCHLKYHLHHETEIRDRPGKKKKAAKKKKVAKKKRNRMSLADYQLKRGLRTSKRITND